MCHFLIFKQTQHSNGNPLVLLLLRSLEPWRRPVICGRCVIIFAALRDVESANEWDGGRAVLRAGWVVAEHLAVVGLRVVLVGEVPWREEAPWPWPWAWAWTLTWIGVWRWARLALPTQIRRVLERA